MTAGWGSRTIRAAMFAAVCVMLAALGHVMMSGSRVPWWTMAAGAAATGAVGWCLAGRERGLPLITSVVVAAQTALHSAFELAEPTGPSTAVDAIRPPDPAHSTHPVDPVHPMDTGSAHMAHTGHTGAAGHTDHVDHTWFLLDGSAPFSSSFGMFAAHLLAALLCGLWLAYGERAVFGLLRAVAGWLAAPLRLSLALPVAPWPPRPRVRRGRSNRSPRRLVLVHAITSRGPPAGTAVI
ncbi:hypothetical protein WBG99_15895 [Streptomyces sp. TG1A-60]|uniref:hypothetical protein n=1 Tax=Streptomyces sp. TG1A-60 TaxID=3129111 RepID=UPI0030D41E8B